MRWIRGFVYFFGFEPQPGSIFYSPSRDFLSVMEEWTDDFQRKLEEEYHRLDKNYVLNSTVTKDGSVVWFRSKNQILGRREIAKIQYQTWERRFAPE